ncbi:four-carbon acid sugar kinase family protein [Sphingobacterium arenae]|uniref:Four-carbon acid sugar kinase family protein n=1 Tax=Sphingobacterium arenae TaxID=1280598 RepID=A0ABR7Y044_9SPHI|nr:four-carbon acid sugar kinase family protein [Sphingobacterium arenae]MBD1424642.1 four-carbon acid sugar kinase family protein [Sphingobacterium arenae]
MAYKIAFYGDDFTGSTDALETLEEMGLDTILFTEVPTLEQLTAFGDKRAIGIAGMTRTLPTGKIEQQLKKVFELFSAIDVKHIHYKVCSTFDSSPEVGSIGKAVDVGAAAFSAQLIPLVVGAPYLGRFCAFGNLFARMGTGQEGEVFRLDRHPSMSKHPVTPAEESDLRRHLAQQTHKKIGLVDVTQLDRLDAPAIIREMDEREQTEVVLFDATTEPHLERIGEVLDGLSIRHQPLFSVGSSAVSKALCAAWKKAGVLSPRTEWPSLRPAKPLLVLSGSGSVVTGRQIAYAMTNGFKGVAIDGVELATNPDTYDISAITEEVLRHMQEGHSVIIHTSIGPDDSRMKKTQQVLRKRGLTALEISGYTASLYGKTLAQIADQVIQASRVERLVIAGGDTSSLFARHLGIEAVEMVAPVVPGAPLCRIHAKKTHIQGMTINFKGGQVGGLDYFLRMERGS